MSQSCSNFRVALGCHRDGFWHKKVSVLTGKGPENWHFSFLAAPPRHVPARTGLAQGRMRRRAYRQAHAMVERPEFGRRWRPGRMGSRVAWGGREIGTGLIYVMPV